MHPDVLAPLRQSPAILSFESMDSHPDILRLMLHAAERDLVQVRARFAQGLVNQEEMWTAESRVHLLGAKLANDPVRFATLQLQSAERAFARTRALFNMGLQTQQKLDDAETVIGIARLRLEQAGGPQGQ